MDEFVSTRTNKNVILGGSSASYALMMPVNAISDVCVNQEDVP
jgi:hypothetical protein